MQLILTVPDMWADHHVLTVRKALAGLPGVAGVEASARDLAVTLTFDPAATGAEALEAALTEAGYPPGDLPAAPDAESSKPAWAAAPRVTGTDGDDLAMSGDYRQY